MKFLRKKVTGNVYVDEATSGIFDYKFADQVDAGYEEAHLVGDISTQAEAEAKWGSISEDDTLACYKRKKDITYKIKSGALLAFGFTHDLNNFNCTPSAFALWIAIKATKDKLALPVKIITKDKLIYTLDTLLEVDALIQSFIDFAQPILEGENQLIADTELCVDKAAVDAITDNR